MSKNSRSQDKPTADKRGAATSLFGPNDPYVKFLLGRKDRTFYLKPWNGNSGDVLIWLGTEYLLKDLGITRTLDPRTADIILIPGGNQTMWQENTDIWKEVWTRWPDKEFVVGPTTVQLGVTMWREDVRESGRNMTGLFVRDPQSYSILSECGLGGRVTIGLSHDPALYLRDSELIRDHRKAGTGEFVLAAFRADHEGAAGPAGRMGRYASLLPAFLSRRMKRRWAETRQREWIAQVARNTRSDKPIKVCDASKYVLEYFFEIVRCAAEVHTDRLHCMLLAAMLGKPTFAYPTAYGKLEAIYAHSVKDWAPVECVGGTEPASRESAGQTAVASKRAALGNADSRSAL